MKKEWVKGNKEIFLEGMQYLTHKYKFLFIVSSIFSIGKIKQSIHMSQMKITK